MGVLNIQTGVTGLSGAIPSFIYIYTNDTLATVTTTGYLNAAKAEGFVFSPTNMALVYTSDQGVVTLQVVISGANVSLQAAAGSAELTLPTVVDQVVYATTITGHTSTAAGVNLFNAGNFAAGKSGTAGILQSYPATASKGYLGIVGVANTGDTAVNISNVAYGQASTVSFADVGSAAGRFLVANTATPFTTGHLPAASGTGGLVIDSGIVATDVMLLSATNTMAAGSKILLDKAAGAEVANAVTINKQGGVITTTSLTTGGGATEVVTLTNSEIVAGAVVLATIGSGTNNATENYLMTTQVDTTAHTAVFTITNNTTATSLNGTLVINFAVF
ncbi:MAG: hypothetical protein ABIP54_02265 [Candidatus Andersenbacteria bacterium]